MKRVIDLLLGALVLIVLLGVVVGGIGLVVAFLWVGVFTNPVALKLLGAMAVVLVIGLAWAAATDDEKEDAPNP